MQVALVSVGSAYNFNAVVKCHSVKALTDHSNTSFLDSIVSYNVEENEDESPESSFIFFNYRILNICLPPKKTSTVSLLCEPEWIHNHCPLYLEVRRISI